MIDGKDMSSIEPDEDVPIIRCILMLFDTAADPVWSVTIAPEAVEPILPNLMKAHFYRLWTKLGESHEEHIKRKLANMINRLLVSAHIQGNESFELFRT